MILNALSWRWMFWFVLPIAVAMLAYGIWKVRNVTTPVPVRIDGASVILSAFGFGGLIYGLSLIGGEGSSAGQSSAPMWISLAVGVVALVLFVLRQLVLQRTDRALLDLRTLRARTFTIAIVLMAISTAALFGTVIVLPIYLQQVLGLSPLGTGLLLLPGGLLMGLLAPIVGRLYDRLGPKPLVLPGSAIVSLVLWGLSLVTDTTPVYLVLVAHVVLSLGLALLFTPLFTAGLGAVQPRFYSHGSAIVGTVQQVAGAAGTALFVTVMAAQSSTLAGGAADAAAAAAGVRSAFLVGGVISLFAIVAAFFIAKPEETTEAPAEADAPVAIH